MDVTCIVATKNSARFLGAALQSIAAQPGVAVEVIVVDAASTDGSREIARSSGARLVDQEGAGLASAWNTGIGLAAAPIIAFLDSDDLWVADRLAARLAALQTSGASVSIGRVRHFVEGGGPPPAGFEHLFGEDAERSAPIPGAMLIRRPVFDAIGFFDPQFAIAADADWLGRMIRAEVATTPFDGLVLLKRLHGANLTARTDRVSAELMEVLRRKIRGDRNRSAPAAPREGGA